MQGKDAEGWRKDLRICLYMIMCQRLFVVHYSLPPLLVLSHFHPLDLPWLSPSTVTTSDRAMLFLLTAVRPNIASAHSSWLKADTFFSGPVSSPCYPLPVFSPFSFSSALLFHLCLFLTNTHRRTHSACLCLAAAGWHHVVEKTVCGNLSQEILVLHTFPFVYFVREKLLRVTAPRSSWGTSWLDSAYTHTHTHTNKHQSGCSVQLFFNFLSV